MDTVRLNLAHNENLYGPAPGCLAVLHHATAADLYGYAPNFAAGVPSPLLQRLAAECRVDPARITLAYGAEDVLKTALMHTLRPGEMLLVPEASWPYYAVLAQSVRARTIEYPMIDDRRTATFRVDVDSLLDARYREPVRAVLIASPNNPTGNPFPLARLPEVLDAYRDALVILDEAYYGLGEHAPDPAALPALTERYPNLLLVRTFSKLHGLAGARIGYAIGGRRFDDFGAALTRYLGYHRLSEKVALAALDDPGHYDKVRARIAENRARISAALGALDEVTVYASEANFVLLRFHPDVSTRARAALTRHGIAVKWMTGPLAHCARITIGTAEHTDELLSVLTAALLGPPRWAEWDGVGRGPAMAAYLCDAPRSAPR